MVHDLDKILTNWSTLNDGLRSIDEKKCRQLLDREKSMKRRIAFLFRIHGKFNLLRYEREKRELLTALPKVSA